MVVASELALPGVARAPTWRDARTLTVGDHVDSGALLADGTAASALAAVREIATRVRAAA
jgi:hypothetical protein